MEGPGKAGRIYFAHRDHLGKGQTLEEHLLGVSRLAGEHAARIGLNAAGSILGLLHDLGKYSGAFQEYLEKSVEADARGLPGPPRGSVDHATAGAQWVWSRLKALGVRDGIVGEILALCIASHHSGLIDCINPGGEDGLTKRMRKPQAETHLPDALANLDSAIRLECAKAIESPELVAQVVDAIRAISQAEDSDSARRFQVGLLARFLFSCLIDADRTDTARAMNSPARPPAVAPDWSRLAGRLESHLASLGGSASVDPLRRRVSEECAAAAARAPGIFRLTVPTGGGKTLASFRFALRHALRYGLERIVYVSPYVSILDQNARIVRQVLEAPDEAGHVVLEHHSNLAPDCDTPLHRLLAENWDVPVVLTTAVQFLETLFAAGTRPVRRMHRLARAVIVFDEVQTLPVRCIHLFNQAANFLAERCGSTLVLCTATQPPLERVEGLKGSLRPGTEIVSDVPSLFQSLRRNVYVDARRPLPWTPAETALLALDEMKRAGSCLVVVNTKSQARAVFDALRVGDSASHAVYHLSTAMCPEHRTRKLREIRSNLRKGVPNITVSTQLIEAGVDISFGAAIRALAGLDSIAQTAGRCNRHGEDECGRVTIVNLDPDLPASLREIREGQQAAGRTIGEWVRARPSGGPPDLADPALMDTYFRYFFHAMRLEMDYPVNKNRVGRDDTLICMLADNSLAAQGPQETYMRQSFRTAAEQFSVIESPAEGVVVPYRAGRRLIAELCADPDPAALFALTRRAQRFSVNVFPQTFRSLMQKGALHKTTSGIYHLDGTHYSEDYGIGMDAAGAMEGLFA